MKDNSTDFHELLISIVTWNSQEYIQKCFESLNNQSFKNYKIVVVDNASNDESVSIIEQNYPNVKIIKNDTNNGYSKAHNQAIRTINSNYVLCMNLDIVLTPEYLDILIQSLKNENKIGVISGKLYQLDNYEDLKNNTFPVIIDSVGLKMYRSRKAMNRGEGKRDIGIYNSSEYVFGHSGALILFDRQALENCSIGGEYFDEDFFAYKEDIDICWRMNLLGWKVKYEPKAIAYHKRKRRSKQRKDKIISQLSYRNHLLMLIKNEYCKLFWRDFHRILPYEIGKFLYITFFEWSTLKSIKSLFKLIPKMLKKRKIIKHQRVVSYKQIKQWF